MKSLILLAAVFASLNAFAEKRGLILTCTNGEEIKLRVMDAGSNVNIDVTVQSTGDSYPTYHYKNVQVAYAKRIGGPVLYHNTQIQLFAGATGDKHGSLTIPALGIKNETLKCKAGQ